MNDHLPIMRGGIRLTIAPNTRKFDVSAVTHEEADMTMKMSAATAVALLGLAPAFGSACEYEAATSASATPPAQLAATPAPEASRLATSSAVKAPVSKKTAKQAVDKSKDASTSDVKVAVVTAR
jgi:hypothetical protein